MLKENKEIKKKDDGDDEDDDIDLENLDFGNGSSGSGSERQSLAEFASVATTNTTTTEELKEALPPNKLTPQEQKVIDTLRRLQSTLVTTQDIPWVYPKHPGPKHLPPLPKDKRPSLIEKKGIEVVVTLENSTMEMDIKNLDGAISKIKEATGATSIIVFVRDQVYKKMGGETKNCVLETCENSTHALLKYIWILQEFMRPESFSSSSLLSTWTTQFKPNFSAEWITSRKKMALVSTWILPEMSLETLISKPTLDTLHKLKSETSGIWDIKTQQPAKQVKQPAKWISSNMAEDVKLGFVKTTTESSFKSYFEEVTETSWPTAGFIMKVECPSLAVSIVDIATLSKFSPISLARASVDVEDHPRPETAQFFQSIWLYLITFFGLAAAAPPFFGDARPPKLN